MATRKNSSISMDRYTTTAEPLLAVQDEQRMEFPSNMGLKEEVVSKLAKVKAYDLESPFFQGCIWQANASYWMQQHNLTDPQLGELNHALSGLDGALGCYKSQVSDDHRQDVLLGSVAPLVTDLAKKLGYQVRYELPELV